MKSGNLLSALLIGLFSITTTLGQTLPGTGGVIPASGSNTYFYLTVSGISPGNMDLNYGLKEICLDITHPNVSELTIQLVSPTGRIVELVMNNPVGGSNYTGTCFSGTATTSIQAGSPPFTGMFRPIGYIGDINNGGPANGTWQLIIKAWNFWGSPGTLNSWSITFNSNPLIPINFTSSNLPIVKINTGGQAIADEPKKIMDMSITYNGIGARNYVSDPPNNYNGKVRIECRGSSTLQFQKKSYGLETCNNSGIDLEVALLGMPAEQDWILYSPYADKSLLRNALSYDLARRMGRYASRYKFVELLIDGNYKGVYILEEKIKRGKYRVDIAKLTDQDNALDPLTGGYILRVDKRDGTEGGWRSDVGPASGTTDTVFFQYYYPKDTTITFQQQSYIQGFMHDFEQAVMSPDFTNAVTGYKKYIDINSFVDFFIINELSKNVDAYKVSTYLNKNRDSKGGKLKIGPIWDFDLAWNNVNYGFAFDPAGWEYMQTATPYEIPQWWSRFMQDPVFVNKLKCRWEQLKSSAVITPAALHAKIDSLANVLGESQSRNFQQWPILEANVWANPTPIPATYSGHISELKNWITNRYNWLNGAMPGMAVDCFVSDESVEREDIYLTVYPNPFIQQTTFKYYLNEQSDITLKIFDILGKELTFIHDKNKQTGEHQLAYRSENLNAGVYFYRFTAGDKSASGKIIIQR